MKLSLKIGGGWHSAQRALPKKSFSPRSSAQLGLARLRGIEPPEGVELGCRWKIEELPDLGHVVHLAATLEDVEPLLGRDHWISVEVGGALLELGEVLDGA
jgi:hypothetical protein